MLCIVLHDSDAKGYWNDQSTYSLIFSLTNIIGNGVLYIGLFKNMVTEDDDDN